MVPFVGAARAGCSAGVAATAASPAGGAVVAGGPCDPVGVATVSASAAPSGSVLGPGSVPVPSAAFCAPRVSLIAIGRAPTRRGGRIVATRTARTRRFRSDDAGVPYSRSFSRTRSSMPRERLKASCSSSSLFVAGVARPRRRVEWPVRVPGPQHRGGRERGANGHGHGDAGQDTARLRSIQRVLDQLAHRREHGLAGLRRPAGGRQQRRAHWRTAHRHGPGTPTHCVSSPFPFSSIDASPLHAHGSPCQTRRGGPYTREQAACRRPRRTLSKPAMVLLFAKNSAGDLNCICLSPGVARGPAAGSGRGAMVHGYGRRAATVWPSHRGASVHCASAAPARHAARGDGRCRRCSGRGPNDPQHHGPRAPPAATSARLELDHCRRAGWTTGRPRGAAQDGDARTAIRALLIHDTIAALAAADRVVLLQRRPHAARCARGG